MNYQLRFTKIITQKIFILYVLSGNIFYQGVKFLLNFLVANLSSPAIFGIWSLGYIISNYLVNINLGILNGVNREVPILIGKNDTLQIDRIFGTVKTVVILLALVSPFFFILVFQFFDNIHNHLTLIVALSLFSSAILLFTFFRIYFASLGKWKLLSTFLFSVAIFQGIIVYLTTQLAAEGETIIFTYVGSFLVILLFWIFKIKINPIIDLALLRPLLRTGFPIMIIGFVNYFFLTVDKILISYFGTNEDLGEYSISFLFFSGLMMLRQSGNMIIFNKLGISYGREFNLLKMKKLVYKLNLFLMPLTLIGIIVFYFVVFYILENYFPEYNRAPNIIVYHLLSFFVYNLTFGMVNVYNILIKSHRYIILLSILSIIYFTLLIIICLHHYSLTNIALLQLLVMIIYTILLYIDFYKITKE